MPFALFHDGHAWKSNAAGRIVDSTRRALAEAARRRCGFDGPGAPRVPGFTPRYPDYQARLDQVIDAGWQPR